MKNNLKNYNDNWFKRDNIKGDLKRKSLQGARNKVTTNGISFTLSIVSTMVLARLLLPEDFGLLAMVTAVTEFARSFKELGLGTLTVQREEITHDEVSTLFWINLFFSIIIMLVLICLSPILVWFYEETRLLYICMALSFVFLLGGLSVQHRALLERQMRLGSLGVINITSTLGGVCIAIALALRGFGVWALVSSELLSAGLYALGVWFLCGWIPGFPKRNIDIKSSLRFGADISGFEIIQYFSRNLDRVLIGRFAGANSLGLYAKAFQLAMMPIEQIRIIFWDIGLSPLSTLQRNAERFRLFYSRLLSVMTFFYMPMVVFIIIHSENVIRLLLGENWISAAPILQIIAIGGFFRPISATFQLVMISCDKTRRCLYWGMVNAAFMIMAFAIGIFWKSIGIACGYAFASYVSLIWSFLYCFKDTPVNARFIIKSIITPLISSLCAGIILVVLFSQMPMTNTLVSIFSSILFITLAYVGILLCIPKGRKLLQELWSYRMEIFT